ncbi:MAG: hypothetical protein KDB79_07285 [Acidobacteria bacterium]|nr:hypothetical protein [Acidobacteriota bacterium]
MRSFIFSVLSVAIFFIGVSALVRDVSAKFGSDAKAMELIRKSRAAIGGDSNIGSVKSMTIGADLEFFGKGGGDGKKAGALEINFEMPNHFSKTVTIGTPGEGTDGKTIKNIETIVISGDDSADLKTAKEGGDKLHKITIYKMGEGEGKSWTSDDGKTVIIEKKDGTIEESSPEGTSRVFVLKDGGDGKKVWKSENGDTIVIDEENIVTDDIKGGEKEEIIIRKKGDGKTKWTSKEETKMIVEKAGDGDLHFQAAGYSGTNELLRTTLALLMTAPEGTEVNYTFAGTGNVDGKNSNIIDVESMGSTFKLYLDASTNLPQMISFMSGEGGGTFIVKGENGDLSKEKMIELKKEMSGAKKVEHQIKFSDFRKVGSLNLPHRWVESAGGEAVQATVVRSFTINPADISSKFKQEKVIVKTMKKKDEN